ncbi:MAG: NAD(P)/FAD-dependent oxidoreductase [Candidatus Hodarchaeales archaeon]|jgi:geranylgeranyl reductase family protein
MKLFDIAVIGAGIAGCLAARTAQRAGLSVALLDRKPGKKIGWKVCGDGLGTRHLRWLGDLGVGFSPTELIECLPDTACLVSPDKQTTIDISLNGKLATINRYALGQLLFSDLEAGGVEIFYKAPVHSFRHEEEDIIVRGRNDGPQVRARTVVDASGVNSAIRRHLAVKDASLQLTPSEKYVCHRAIIKIKSAWDSTTMRFEFDQIYFRGGYAWIFPKTEPFLNIGLGIPGHRVQQGSPKATFKEYFKGRFEISQIVEERGGSVPTTHPLATNVFDKFILIGDAGQVVNPIHGGGIGSSLYSGYLAGQTVVDAFERGDASQTSLWKFNTNLFQRYGARFMLLNLFRLLLQSLSNDQLNQCFAEELLPFNQLFFLRDYAALRAALETPSINLWPDSSIAQLQELPRALQRLQDLVSQHPKNIQEFSEWTHRYRSFYGWWFGVCQHQ